MELNLPPYDLRTDERDGTTVVYDPIRQKYVRRTPEEWVRQHFVQYLIQELDVPSGLVAIEHGFRYQGRRQRADVVVHDRQGEPLVLVECKAPDTPIQQSTFDQGARYNGVLGAPFLVVTNGREHYACAIDFEAHTYAFLDDLPDYEALLAKRSGG
jgi:hypothetical protein